jgi:hypothetical protein
MLVAGEGSGVDDGAVAADRVGVAVVGRRIAGREGRDHGGDPLGVGCFEAEGVAGGRECRGPLVVWSRT